MRLVHGVFTSTWKVDNYFLCITTGSHQKLGQPWNEAAGSYRGQQVKIVTFDDAAFEKEAFTQYYLSTPPSSTASPWGSGSRA